MTRAQSFGCDKANWTDSVKLLILSPFLPSYRFFEAKFSLFPWRFKINVIGFELLLETKVLHKTVSKDFKSTWGMSINNVSA